MIEIKHRFTGAVLFKSETAETVRAALLEGIGARANLAHANLSDAYLADADLAGANLAGANLAHAYLAGADLARANLADADLAGADLARANLADADLAGAYLAGAYLAGAYLAGADLAGANLAGANLAGAYLADADLADADLAGANLADADLADADLARANLADADLAGAYLARAYLARARNLDPSVERTDPPTPYVRAVVHDYASRAKRYREHHPEVPVVENLDARILESVTTGGGELDMGNWHACDTTHCRGGWAIHHAGKAGYELQNKVGVERAARMIYLASTGRAPHFYATNERALEDIKRCAGEEALRNGEGAK